MKRVRSNIWGTGRLASGLAILLLALLAAACVPSAPAANVPATVQASIAATAEAQQAVQDAVNASVAATVAASAAGSAPEAPTAVPPTDAPLPTATPAIAQATATADADATAIAEAVATARAKIAEATQQVPAKAEPALQHVLEVGPGEDVWAVAYSPDGSLIALGSIDNTATIWDAASGKRLQTMRGHTDPVSGIAFSSDGKWLATSGMDATVRLWDVATGRELRRFDQHEEWVNSVVFGPGDAWLLTGSDDWTARIFDVATGAEVRRIEPEFNVNEASLSADGRQIALGGTTGHEGYAAIYDANTGELVRKFYHEQTGAVGPVSFSPDGRLLATGDYGNLGESGDKYVFIWDAAGGELLRQLSGHQWSVMHMVFSSDGRQLASCDQGANVIVWDVATWRILHKIAADGDTKICDVAFSPDGRYLTATGDPDGTAKVWEVAALP